MKTTNRTIALLAVLLWGNCFSALCETNFYDHVKSLWFAGKQHVVYQISQERLSKDPNDLAGLLLKAEYEGDMMQLADMTNTLANAIQAGSTCTGTNFARWYPLLKADLPHLIDAIQHYPPEEYAADLLKTNLTRKTMSCDMMIRALQEDGFFQE